MKKLLAILLSLSMVLTSGIVSVFADDEVPQDTDVNEAVDELKDQDVEPAADAEQDAAEGVKVDETNFPDELFRKYVSDNFDKDNDGVLSDAEISKATKIDVKGSNIVSLKGIELLTELTYLDCSSEYIVGNSDDEPSQYFGGRVEELDVSKNLKLETLIVNSNGSLNDFDISNNTKLKVLEALNVDSLTNVNAAACPDLEVLNLDSTGITSIDVTKNPKLKKLILNMTMVPSVDVSKNPELEVLDLTGLINEDWEYVLSEIDVTHNPKLKELDVSMSQIETIDTSKNPELEILNAYISPLKELDLSNNKKMVRIAVSNTQISSIDVRHMPELFALDVEMTNVSEIDVTHNPKLYEVYMTGCKDIKEIDLSKNPNMTHLRISGTSITKLDTSKNPELAAFYNYRQSAENPITWDTVEIEPAPLEEFDFSKNPKMFEMYLGGSNVEGLNVSNMPGLKHLALDDTNIKTLDVTKNTQLVSLRVNNTALKELDLSKNKNLATLTFSNTDIKNLKNLDFTGYKKMLNLECENAGVESIVFDAAPSMHNLKCSGNAIAEIDLEGRKNPRWGWFDLSADDQNAIIKAPKDQMDARKVFLQDIFEDPSRIDVTEGEGYTYNADEQSITFNEGAELKFSYVYDSKFGTGSDDKFAVNATLEEKPEQESRERIYGSSRYDTSFKAADKLRELQGGKRFKTVVLATGSNFADALAGGYLANKNNAPVILVNSADENSVIDYVNNNLKSKGKVYILGGTGAVSANVEKKLSSDYDVERLGGASRYDTNLEILKAAGVSEGEVLVCNGQGFADCLPASAVDRPILLVNNADGKFNKAQQEFVDGLNNPSFTILGGTGVISKKFEDKIAESGKVERLGGATRYETSRLIAEHYFPNTENVVLVYGQNFPDGLSGGPIANTTKAPLLLVENNAANYKEAETYFKASGAKRSIALGGPTLISEKTWDNIVE